jgi:hypothetical protein
MSEPFFSPEYHRAIEKLERYGMARDRLQDRRVRRVILSDDEAVAVLDACVSYEQLLDDLKTSSHDEQKRQRSEGGVQH